MAGSREDAYVHAVMSAALVHSVIMTNSNSPGYLSKCPYETYADRLASLSTGWKDALDYGLWLSKTFADPVADEREPSRTKMEIIAAKIHNNAVGRMVSQFVSS